MKSLKRNSALAVLVGAFSLLAWSCTDGAGGEGVQDTVFLESGVKYVYINQGDGPTVDSGSHVFTHINLMVKQDTVWSTHSEGEEIFEFDAKRTSLIDGFDEVVMYAKEGDRILAIIPSELGYGTRGSGDDIPPNSTLYFDLEFLKVGAPRIFLSDVLFESYEQGGISEALLAYENFEGDTVTHNIAINEWYVLHRKVMAKGGFEDAVSLWERKLSERPYLGGYYYMAVAYDSLKETEMAIKTLKNGLISGADTTGNTAFIDRYLRELESR